MEVKINGFDKLQNFLDNFPKGVQEEILVVGGKQAGKEVRASIVDKASHAFNAWTGKLHRPTAIAINVKPVNHGEVLIQVGPKKKYFYAYFLELGTQFMHARPFIRPGFDAAKNKIFSVFRKSVMGAANKRRTRHAGYSSRFGEIE